MELFVKGNTICEQINKGVGAEAVSAIFSKNNNKNSWKTTNNP